MEPELSLVIPAYNESRRLPGYLGAIRDHLSRSDLVSYEVIVVDDGSDDGMGDIVAELAAEWSQLSLGSV